VRAFTATSHGNRNTSQYNHHLQPSFTTMVENVDLRQKTQHSRRKRSCTSSHCEFLQKMRTRSEQQRFHLGASIIFTDLHCAGIHQPPRTRTAPPPWQQLCTSQSLSFSAAEPMTTIRASNRTTASEQPRCHPPCRHAQPREGEKCESETLILGRDFAPRVRLLLDNQTGQHRSNGQSQQSKMQKWLNKRGRIGNWTEIKLLIN